MATEPDSDARVPEVIERFVRQLIVTDKAVSLYPPSSAIPRDTARDAVNILDEALRETPEVRFAVTRDGLFYEDLPVFPGHHTFTAFAREFYNRMLADVRFHAGTEPSDLIAFLTILNYPPDELAAAGGFEARLWEQNVGTISVTEAKITLIDAEAPAFLDDSERLSIDEIDELVAKARRGGAGEQITIARFMSNPSAVRAYLTQSLVAGGATGFDRMTDSFVKLAHLASALTASEQDERMRSLAEAVLSLAEEVRKELIGERLLPEARSSAPVAAVVRQMDIDQICRMFAEGAGADVRTAMVRAIRNLSAVSGVDHDAVARAAGSVLLGNGIAPEEVDAILEEAAPSQLAVGNASGAAFSRPNDAVIQLIDSAPVSAEVATRDPEILALKEEARQGVTDGDVIGALVTLVTLDSSEHNFDVTMTRLESAISLLIERGELEAAAEVTVMLGNAAKNPALTDAQRTRLVRAVARFACAEDLKAIVEALRLYPPGSIEHTSAMKLINMLGPLALKPLLEQLADEPDMASRKSLVDVISGIAPAYISELGEQVADPRWFFVRNVVSILASTKSPAVLPYLERTLRYPEPRVRRETIRALSQQGEDRLAAQMLVRSLYDDDAQNVQLAARFIGQRGIPGAVPTLEQVARGEGRGNRDTGPRVEAIEALGRLGAVEAMPTLRMLAGRRALLRGAKARELRSSALGAIQRIEFLEGVK